MKAKKKQKNRCDDCAQLVKYPGSDGGYCYCTTTRIADHRRSPGALGCTSFVTRNPK
jgi:hypothetical protein